MVNWIGILASTAIASSKVINADDFKGILIGIIKSTGILIDNPTGNVSIINMSIGTTLCTGKTSSNPIDFIERYCSNLPIPKNIKYIAEFIAIKSIFKNLVDDNTAPSVAAGSIFLACNHTNQNISKKQVAIACKTSEVTISKCFKKLNEKRFELLPEDIIKEYKVI